MNDYSMQLLLADPPIGGGPTVLPCPLCANPLHRDPWWASPHWYCRMGHGYSNPRVLIAELRERGLWPPPSGGPA